MVWTYDATAVGTNAGTVRLYRDGVLDKAEIQGAVPNVSASFNILIGGQHGGAIIAAGGFDAAGVVGKVRVHDGVLSGAQVLNNYNFESGFFTNGTPAAFLTTAPYHRLSFNQPPTNNAIGLTVPDTGSAAGAAAGASNNFLSQVTVAYVLAGGAVVDSGANTITIAEDLNTDYTGGGLGADCQGHDHQMGRHYWGYGDGCDVGGWTNQNNFNSFYAHAFYVR